MRPKDRVHAALRKEPVDRVPVFMWLHPDTKTRLSDILEVPPAALDFVFGNDVRQTWVNNNYAMEGIVHEHDGEGHIDDWGIEWVKGYSFNQIKSYPLAEADGDAVLDYQFPYEKLPKLMQPMDEVAARGEDYFIGCDVSPCAFEMYWRLRGMENTLLDFALNKKLASAFLQKCIDFAAFLSREAIQRYQLDWLWTGDDVAGQNSMIISPEMWRELIKKPLRDLFDIGKRAGLYVAYHCCGALRPIIPDLIEMGLDVLNPVQCLCPDMEPLDLKREFGDQLAFMGGLDTQELMPRGTTADVHRETRRLIDGMTSDGGGFILAATHTLPPETPLENIFALYEALGLTKEEIMDRAADFRVDKDSENAG